MIYLKFKDVTGIF